uniref:Periviscerokinin-1 n=1 Tax=Therea petiveriana TaxID=45965 RepID=PVK1_THEPT|nr:RecName: Full=Periviscerokinin-1; Short=ThePe-PVK-1 [Therea petiveriana]
GSSGLISFPRN